MVKFSAGDATGNSTQTFNVKLPSDANSKYGNTSGNASLEVTHEQTDHPHRDRTAILITMLVGQYLIAALLALGGWYLVGDGNSTLNLFGATLKTSSIGVVGLFCAAVVLVFCVRQTTAIFGSAKIKTTN